MITERQIERIAALTALGLLVAGCFLVLGPFLSAVLWAVILSFSTWPLYCRLLSLFGNRSTLAASVMTLLLIVTLIAPFVILAVNLGDNVASLAKALYKVLEQGPPQPPAWIGSLPMVGAYLQSGWQSFAQDSAKFMAELQKLAAPAMQWLLNTGLVFGQGFLHLCLSVLIAFFFYRDGAMIADRLDAGMARIAGERAQYLLQLAGATVRGVVYGILGTALAQGILAGLGFWMAGVPGPLFLGLITFFFSVIPMGPPLIWVPASLWLFYQGATGWGVFLLVWGVVVVSSIDNIIKPYLISQGSDLPFILVLLGVLGGALAFGLVGIFLGPTLLAVGYNLIREWTLTKADPHAPESSLSRGE